MAGDLLGKIFYARWLIPGDPPALTGTPLVVVEVHRSKGTRRKDRFGQWETFGKGSRILVQSPVGFKYWVDPDQLTEEP